MGKFFNIVALSISLLLIGCNSEDELIKFQQNDSCGINKFHIPLDEALNIADALLSNLDENGTRSERLVSKVEVKRVANTRSKTCEADTLLYLVNYEDDRGFALLSADKRLPLVYAISDEGHFEFSDTISNAGLAFFMNTVNSSIEYRLNNTEDVSTTRSDVTIEWPVDYYEKFRGIYNVNPPLLGKQMSVLNQRSPWNKYCFYNGERTYTGCAPLALATFMSLYQWPSSYEGMEIDWVSIREDNTNDTFAKFIRVLWERENLNVHPEFSDSGEIVGMGALNTRIVPTLRNMGYTVPNGLQNFNAEEVCKVLLRGIDRPYRRVPVLARGCTGPGKNGGHVWVIDGYMKQHGKPGGGIISPGLEPQYNPNMPMYLFHCVWGWGGYNNGFFSFDENVLGAIHIIMVKMMIQR